MFVDSISLFIECFIHGNVLGGAASIQIDFSSAKRSTSSSSDDDKPHHVHAMKVKRECIHFEVVQIYFVPFIFIAMSIELHIACVVCCLLLYVCAQKAPNKNSLHFVDAVVLCFFFDPFKHLLSK